LERVRTEVRELLLGLLGCQQPDAGTLLRPGFREDELRAAFEPEAKRRQLRALLTRAQVPHAASGHLVEEQYEIPVRGRKEEALSAAPHSGEPPALERRE